MTTPDFRPTAIDAAVDAAVRHLHCEDDLANRDLAEAVDAFMAQLAEVATYAKTTPDMIAAAEAHAAGSSGAVAAAWRGYLGGIRGMRLAYQAQAVFVAEQAQRIARGET